MPGGKIGISQSDIDVYLNVKTFKNEPTSSHNVMKTGLFNVGHKSNEREGNTVEEDNGGDVQGAEYQGVSATGSKWRKER